MKNLKDYQDEYGLIGNRDPVTAKFDFGDSAQRDGTNLIVTCLALGSINIIGYTQDSIYPKVMDKHEASGWMYRHTYQTMIYDVQWWDLSTTMSRDQSKPLIIAMGFFNDRDRLKRVLKRFLKRFMFCQNTRGNWDDTKWKIPDWAGPDCWSNFLRSFRANILWLGIFACDLFILGNALARIYYGRKDFDNVGDDLNLCLDLIQADNILPTPITKLAKHLYFKYRPAWRPMAMTSGWEIDPTGFGPQYAWDRYFRQLEAPPMNDVIRPVLEAMR